MILDALLQFSDAQSLAVSANSTNTIDLGVARRIGRGVPLVVVLFVTTLLDATTGDETYTVAVQTNDNEAFSSPATIVAATSMPRGSAAGTTFILPIPSTAAVERYLRLAFTSGGTTPLGAVSAFLQPLDMIQGHDVYPDAITIS